MANAATPATRKRLALAMIDYLNTSLTDGTLQPEDRESIEVATSCIADAFKVDGTDSAAIADALGQGQNLLSIYTVYEKLRGKSTPSTEGDSSAKEARPSTPQTPGTGAGSTTKNAEAEALKGQGNAAMQKKDYSSAIDCYTRAIALDPVNPIYLSNRAAAYSATSQHQLAKEDAELAVAGDPKYTKAWSRLGLARFALNDAKGSMEAYKRGIDAEGNGGSEAMKKGYETARKKVEELEQDDVTRQRSTSPTGAGAGGGMPDLGSLASMFGGGGGGGGGGMPDFSEMMKNPMMQQMAQNLMSNPEMMNNLMNNPKLKDMANQYMGGGGGGGAGGAGGAPDIASLMQDPSIAEMAKNFMGGAGGAGGAGRGAGSGAGS